MKQWIQMRIEWIDQQFIAAPAFSLKGGSATRGSKLDLRAPTGMIYYTLDGTDPRGPGGAVSPAAQPFRSALTLNKSTVVFCRACQTKCWSCPAVARFVVGEAGSER